jgi:hypothetical protein
MKCVGMRRRYGLIAVADRCEENEKGNEQESFGSKTLMVGLTPELSCKAFK